MKPDADVANRADAQPGDDLALGEFASERELGSDFTPSVERGDLPDVSRIDVVYLDAQAPIEFLSETELSAVDTFVVVAEPVAYVDVATAGETDRDTSTRPAAPANSVVSRTWRTPEIRRRAIHGALAVAALGAILLLYEIPSPNDVPPANGRPTASTTLQSGSAVASDATSSVPRTSISAEIDRAIRDSKGEDPRNHLTAEVRSQPPAATLPDTAVHARSEFSAELVSQSAEDRDTGEAERNLASTAELPKPSPERAAEVLAATESTPANPGSAFRDSEPSAATPRTGADGDDDLSPVPSTASPRETVLSSSDSATPVRDLLSGYQAAYASLDAHLAKQIWPAVDERALERAFDALESQTVTFDTCDLTMNDRRAVASCRGRATYVTRIGRRSSHTESRQWTFLLEKPAERWIIGAVQIR